MKNSIFIFIPKVCQLLIFTFMLSGCADEKVSDEKIENLVKSLVASDKTASEYLLIKKVEISDKSCVGIECSVIVKAKGISKKRFANQTSLPGIMLNKLGLKAEGEEKYLMPGDAWTFNGTFKFKKFDSGWRIFNPSTENFDADENNKLSEKKIENKLVGVWGDNEIEYRIVEDSGNLKVNVFAYYQGKWDLMAEGTLNNASYFEQDFQQYQVSTENNMLKVIIVNTGSGSSDKQLYQRKD